MLDEQHPPQPGIPGDDNAYVLGRIHRHNVAMACLPGQYGTNNAAIVATNVKRSFPSIRATLMVGIAGGSPSQADLYLGDVVVGTRVMQYDMGKALGDGHFQGTAIPKTPAPLLNSAVSTLRSKQSSDRIASFSRSRLPNLSRPDHPDRLFQASYEHHPLRAPTCNNRNPKKLQPRAGRLSDEPKIHYGVIASANRVMRNGKERDEIARLHSALCFEMEAAGMMDNVQCLPIRGICDYSDSHKNKVWQDYAAATAAAYARELLEVIPASSGELSRANTTRFNNASEPDTADDQASERRQRLLESLNFAQIDARKTTIRTAHSKTCRWFVRHSAYRDWLDPAMQSQNHGFLWMRGKAGAGKSTMMKFVYLESKKRDGSNTMSASFFFNARGEYLEKSITGMYRSLLMQLLKRFPDLQSILDNTDIIPASQQDCPDLDALKELLRSALLSLGQRSFTCFIDALDECDEQEVRDMVQFFEDLAEDTAEAGIQLRICFSSRPYPYISTPKGILLTLEDESGHAEDLAQYVESKLKIDDPVLRKDLQLQILGKASGIFLWIVLVVDILNEEDDDGGLALRTKLSKIPDKLSDLFKSILMRDQKSPERLLLCVLWILCAKRPLTPAEFRHALWVALLDQQSAQNDRQVDSDVPDVSNMNACVKLVTSSSKGLAEITKSKQPTVQFVHESVRDFLVKEKGLQDLWPELGFEWEGPSHERLKRCCTTYLSLSGVQAIVNDPEGRDVCDALAQKYSFLEYASQQVLHHANAAAFVVPQDEFMSQFFASAGIGVVNLFERHKKRRYGVHATPIYVLADRGLENLIRTRIKQEPAARAPRERKDLTGYKGRTPLSWAAQKGRLSIVKVFVDRGADVNSQIKGGLKDGWTALMLASDSGHEAVARLLIDRGADINAQEKDKWTALMLASNSGHEAVARLLIDRGADINSQIKGGLKDGWTALMLASDSGHEAVARLLIDRGADINAQEKDKWTALMLASNSGHEAVARLLIDRGADINSQIKGGLKDGWTALMLASDSGHEAVAQLLIDRGADVN
ncbi:hypothetical protein RB597_010494 [Gaeumannomyces tritici]